MKKKLRNIILVIVIWEFFHLLLTMVSIQKEIETRYFDLLILFLLFYMLGKKQAVTFSYFQKKIEIKQRLLEVLSAYGWKEVVRILSLLCIAIVAFLIQSIPELSANEIGTSPTSLVHSILLSCMLTPLVEEFVFRGVIFDLMKPYKRRFAMCFNIVLFSFLHISSLNILNAILLGIALYELREKHNDLISCIVLHILNNGLAILNAYGYGEVCFVITLVSVVYYAYTYYKWKKQTEKSDESKRNLCVKT